MKKLICLLAVFIVGLFFVFASGDRTQDIKALDLKSKTGVTRSGGGVKPDLNFGKIPLYFIVNKGQVNKKAAFYAKASRYTLWLTKEGLVFDSIKTQGADRGAHISSHSTTHPKTKRDVSRLMFIGAHKNPGVVPIDEAKLKINYFKGNDRSRWNCDIPTSMAVLYKNLYKNIDLKVYGLEKQIEYDWIVKAGGDPRDIKFEYTNVKGTRIDEEGNLLIETGFGELMHKKPVSYQMAGAQRVTVEAGFKKIAENTYGFEVGAYDRSRELIIDPVVLAYSTYLGGGNADVGYDIAVDAGGNVYVTGFTNSTNFPTLNQFQTDPGDADSDVFVIRLDPTQSGAAGLIYSTYLGGSNLEYGYGIAVDAGGNAYVTGYTASIDFPTLNQYQAGQGGDVFVTRLDTTQSGAASLIYSTYLSGGSGDYGYGIAVDAGGNAYVTGYTQSTDFPTLNQYQADQGEHDAFVTRLDTTQSGAASLIYSTYLGGRYSDIGHDIAIDAGGNAYVVGYTTSTDFPTLNQYQVDPNDFSSDVFVTRLDTTKSGVASLIYSTYLGGESDDFGYGIAVDTGGNAYVTGSTWSQNFPTLNQYLGDQFDLDVFVTRLDTTQSGASSLIYSTYLGGGKMEKSFGIAVDGSGNAYVTGYTESTDFPILNQYQGDQLGDDVFVTRLDTTQSGASSLIYSTYLGGGEGDEGNGIAVDTAGNAYVTGYTDSTDFSTLNQYQGDQVSRDTFVTKLSFQAPSLTVTSPNGGENWSLGSTQNITWASSGLSANLKITLWKDGALIGVIADGIDPAPGAYSWTVGQYGSGTVAPGTGYTVKIKEKGTTVVDVSDASFTLSPSITVTSPNGGENWQIGSTQNITWDSYGLSANLKITLWKDGALIGVIADGIDPAAGTYPWTVGQYRGGTVSAGTGYTVKIKEKGTTVADFSDASFTLTD